MDTLEFTTREQLGNSSKRLLNEGLVPSVVYNAKGESYSVSIPAKVAEKLLKTATSTTILDSKLNGKATKVVLKDIDRNPLTLDVRHISFFQIDEEKPMIFSVPFKFIGISPAVKNNLGILVKALSSIDVRCKIADLIPEIEIDVAKLEHPGQSLTVRELELPKGMTLPNDEQLNNAIVTITQIQKVEEVAPVAEAEAVATPEAAAE